MASAVSGTDCIVRYETADLVHMPDAGAELSVNRNSGGRLHYIQVEYKGEDQIQILVTVGFN